MLRVEVADSPFAPKHARRFVRVAVPGSWSVGLSLVGMIPGLEAITRDAAGR
jgi:hypothetical protein